MATNGKPKPPPPAQPSGAVGFWMQIAESNPYPVGTHRWYTFAFVCRNAIGWAQTVDNYRECRSKEAKAIYGETATHHANRLSGLLHLLDLLAYASDVDPLYKKRAGRTKAQRKRGM